MADQKRDSSDDLASLEAQSTVVQPGDGGVVSEPAAQVVMAPDGAKTTLSLAKRAEYWFKAHLNIYLVLFIFMLLASGGGGLGLYIHSSAPQSSTLSQPLSQKTLDQLSSSDISVGEPKHILSVQSDTIFGGNVLVRDNLQIAGTLQVGSNLAIAGLRVTGNSTFDDVQITKALALTGNGAVQGQLSVQKSLSVNGSGTFHGALSAASLTIESLDITGNLNLTSHVTAGGSTPSRSNGGALGGGGTASVSGSDTAGSVTLNTGSGPAAGCYITVTFATKFNSTPHVVIAPIGSAASNLHYYVNRTTSSFSVCSTTAPSSSTTYVFDYIALD